MDKGIIVQKMGSSYQFIVFSIVCGALCFFFLKWISYKRAVRGGALQVAAKAKAHESKMGSRVRLPFFTEMSTVLFLMLEVLLLVPVVIRMAHQEVGSNALLLSLFILGLFMLGLFYTMKAKKGQKK